MEPLPQLTNEEWLLLSNSLLDAPLSPADGRPRIPPRAWLERIGWLLRSGAHWNDLAMYFPSPATSWRRLDEWSRADVFQNAWARVLRKLDGFGRGRWEEAIAEGTFLPARKRVCASARRNAARERRSVFVDRKGQPLGVDVVIASPNVVDVVEPLMDKRLVRRPLPRLLYDRSADSDLLRARPARRGTDSIRPHRGNQIKPPAQDKHSLQRYK